MEREEGPLSYEDQDQIYQETRERVREEFKAALGSLGKVEEVIINDGELNIAQKLELKENLEALMRKLG